MSYSDTVRQLLKLQEAFNVPEVIKLFDKDATYQSGNSSVAAGVEQIRRVLASGHPDTVTTMKFDVKDMIELGDGVLVSEMEVTYGMKDGRKIVLPCTDLFRFNNRGLVQDLKVYIDPGPLFQPPAT